MKKLSILNLVLTVILVLNVFIVHSPVLGVVLGLAFIICSSYLLNRKKILFGFLLFLCTVIIPLTIVYYIFGLSNFIIIVWLILFSVLLLVKSKKLKVESDIKDVFNEFNVFNAFKILIYLILLLISYLILKNGQTLEPVRTPWFFVSKWFFVFYFLATASLIYLCTRKIAVWIKLVLSSLHLFFTFSITNIIFPLGFGFDPFIHQATEKYILANGFILPKKLYYIGQYSLVYFLTKIFQISHVFIDKNLVPLLSAVLLPSSIYYYAFKKIFNKNSFFTFHFSLFIFLLIPFTFLTFTTPQNLGYLLVLVLIFLSLDKNKLHITHYALPITIFLIHPIAGLAAIIFVLVLLTQRCKIKSWLKNIFYIFLCFVFPVVFLSFSLITGFSTKIVNNFNLSNLVNNLFRWSPDLFLNSSPVHFLKTIIYFLWQPISIFVILFILSILYLIKNKSRVTHYPLLITFFILFVNSILLFSFVNFEFLIQYERGDFAWRVFNLAVFFLIPLVIMGVWSLICRIPRQKVFWLGMTTLIISSGITTSLYFSYPRQDVYYYERGFNTSKYDFQTIEYLEENTNEDYVVLANQQVGAGALFKYGFRYYKEKYFFYSIPTGGDLYQIYWNVVYEDAGRKEIKKASELTGAKVIYVYFPDYWFNLKKMEKNLTNQADRILDLDGGVVFEFRY